MLKVSLRQLGYFVAAAETGSITVKTPARGAGTWASPFIHSHTVTMLAASA